MFLEIPTIWKKKKIPNPIDALDAPPPEQTLNRFQSRSTTTKFLKTQSLSIWRPRRIAVFFAQNFADGNLNDSMSKGKEPYRVVKEPSWTSLVLVEPLTVEADEQLLFCYRKIEDKGQP